VAAATSHGSHCDGVRTTSHVHKRPLRSISSIRSVSFLLFALEVCLCDGGLSHTLAPAPATHDTPAHAAPPQEVDQTSVVRCLQVLDEAQPAAEVLTQLLRASLDKALLAYQIAFDLVESENQVRSALSVCLCVHHVCAARACTGRRFRHTA
jgi:hypothetical protein